MHRQLLEDGHHIRVVQPQQLPAVDLEQLVAAAQPAVLPHRAVGQDGADVVVRVLLGPVHLLDGALQADTEAAALLELANLGHYNVVLRPHQLRPLAL